MRNRTAVAAGLMLVGMIFVPARHARELMAAGAFPAGGPLASLPPVPRAASSTIKEQLIGTWRLDSRTIRRADGSESFDPRYGEHPVGYISYDRTGYMSVQFMKNGRPKEAGAEGYEAYFGTYSVDEQKKTVTHHVQGHLLPDRVGQDLVRSVEIHGDQLRLLILNAGAGKSANAKAVTNFNDFTRMK